MIPYEFNFSVKDGTGKIFHAQLTDDFDNIEYHITNHGIDCKYTVREVMDFLSKGRWIEYYIGVDYNNEV